ncbi:uncharacterized protein B0T15DRAFT_390329 [Chaetomium strumarium]|uniref:Ubiquitin carboxyl-terminal hydrolase n=1 Tax=Chaetomium strumarium TaxID=1170767 RepID=A0AAJ0M3R8_9PEZI|nr:hypothetical protein B0T15DRAFT_390329 [Chaetomium strumarium]
MGPAPAGGAPPRRGGRQHYPPAHAYHPGGHHHQHVGHPMYATTYMPAAYGAPQYYMPPQYQNGAMAAPAGYMPYPNAGYVRSPPAMPHYIPVQQPYGRPSQHSSPIVSSPYHPPPPTAPAVVPPLPHTPSSTHSYAVPPPMTPPVRQVHEAIPAPPPVQQSQLSEPQPETQTEPQQQPQTVLPPSHQVVDTEVKPTSALASPASSPKAPFRPPLPWTSTDWPFPPRAARLRRKRRFLGADAERLELPEKPTPAADVLTKVQKETEQQAPAAAAEPSSKSQDHPPRSEAPSTPAQPSEDAVSTSPTSPSSVQSSKTSTTASAAPTNTVKPSARSAVPAVPVIPALPKASPKESKPATGAEKRSSAEAQPAAEAHPAPAAPGDGPAEASQAGEGVNGTTETEAPKAAQTAPAPAKPKLWTGLFKAGTSTAGTSSAAPAVQGQTNGNAADGSAVIAGAGSFAKANASSLAQVLQAYRPGVQDRLSFLEPRGLVNTGNMCYMNSVLQVLIFCVPLYHLLDLVGKNAAHSFKSETPLIDAMVMFMREFKVIDSAPSAEQLRKRLKSEEYEKYGEPFTPEFVYEAIRTLPRFASMRRGHQQDAQEFLGFLLEHLHDECVQVMRAAPASTASTAPNSSLPSPTSSRANDALEGGDDWLEVGPRQRAAVTRSSGHPNTLSPITKIFGGQLRSELRVPGNKNSVTLEPYQPLQLDIGSPEIRNIIDALKGLTRPEVLHGDFNSPHGKDVRATKQVFIESVPSVLILHLKRFQFDAEGSGGTVKIWKKIGYPLEFEFPREVLSRQTRNTILAENSGAPRYRLIAVVYHHGKNASVGHYTVDVRRQDGREWIRIDDTVIRRVRDEDVAEGGAEEEAGKVDGRKDTSTPATANRFLGINDEDAGDDDGWKQAAGGKKWSSVVNGATSKTSNGQQKAKQQHKESMKENKVAYLLFYQRI